ncbi:hypothetical protein [Azospira sp. I13]|uniref:hypothetical protein n=1 Tax=Azospira sp. I13 TaxID=1765050 RepID=UPI001057CA0C|nr:hypothetical protein [Azospira sp. I13]
MIAQKIGRIDALLFFVIWSCVGLLSATHSYGALPIIVFLLVPASALVGWRGTVSVRLILAGAASLRRAAIDGFIGGAAFVLVIWLWGFSNAALAAGTVFDGLSPWQFEFWLAVATTLLPAMGAAGVVGALHGIAFFFLNRWLIRANTPVNPDAPTSGAPVT